MTAPTAPKPAHAAVEQRDTHLAVCRWRRQGLICSTCNEVVERAWRALGAPVAREA